MNKFILSLIFAFIAVSVTAETVYKKTNPDGSVTFTDLPSMNSEEVKIRKPTTYSPVGLPNLNLPTKKLKPSFNYELTISQPINDSTITNQTDISVSAVIQPALKTGYGHQVRFQLSDQSITSHSASVTFKNISRGTHNISVSVVDRNGSVVSPVASSVFHLKRFFKKPVVVKPKAVVP